MVLYAPPGPADHCRPSAPQRRQPHRLALVLFALAALAGLLVRYLP